MSSLEQYFLFLGQGVTLVILIFIALVGIIAITAAAKRKQKQQLGELTITPMNKQYDELEEKLSDSLLSKQHLKAWRKDKEKSDKKAKKTHGNLPRLYVIDFNGDMRASQSTPLSRCIDAVLLSAREGDRVLLRLESPGGAVNGYGLAASELARLRQAKIELTVAVDKVAASGGYMMACIANTIIAAPFAIIGSIGVVATLPNVHRWLKKHDIDVEMITAGKYKRTLTVVGENTKEGRDKMQDDIQEVHELFQEHVKNNRPAVDINEVSTGEYWYGQQCIDLKLVDEISTSSDFLLQLKDQYRLYLLRYEVRQSKMKKLLHAGKNTIESLLQTTNR